ncbi:hypothetical protein EGK75_07580 [Neisseria weixii]|uniref:DNA adenine methylase n=1 Tax=Neisseria weixii TaxID=1853276 RepID=A0A3N4MR96_9NEIS|nr:DNA adenine methylase [Neisseria weixii]RPD86231.1 hypothetical protein EGK74_08295 [Neisseria weixii]RPD87215.1 hypothetical protein EGK75_07580 [Neisseria weixii]
MTKVWNQAPIPFVGQKRFFLQLFKESLKQIPDDGAGWVIVDVFGGSGLLAHTAKRNKPAARVTYNDFDGYAERLNNIPDYNRLLAEIQQLTKDVSRGARLPQDVEAAVKSAIRNFDGAIDVRVLSSWLLFSTKQAVDIEQLLGWEFYNKVRKTPFNTCDGYLDGLEIVSENYVSLMRRYQRGKNILFVLDPPYVGTDQFAYKNEKYFNMVSFLKLIHLTRPPFILFSSNRSEICEYIDYLKEYEPQAWSKFADAQIHKLPAKMAKGVSYEDNMVVKF